MAAIRPESEIDRTQAALAADEATLPLPSGRVEVEIAAEQAASPVGQRLLVTLVNELARMKGVVSTVHVIGAAEQGVLPGVPLTERTLAAGLAVLVDSLNAPASELRAQIEFGAAADAAARVLIGDAPGGGLSLGADAWRGLLGTPARESDWQARAPYGAALAAALGGAETFKTIVEHNLGPDPARRAVGPCLLSVQLRDRRKRRYRPRHHLTAPAGPSRCRLRRGRHRGALRGRDAARPERRDRAGRAQRAQALEPQPLPDEHCGRRPHPAAQAGERYRAPRAPRARPAPDAVPPALGAPELTTLGPAALHGRHPAGAVGIQRRAQAGAEILDGAVQEDDARDAQGAAREAGVLSASIRTTRTWR